MELSDFALPHNPSSQHQLHWTPGSYGKGILTRDKILHTWNTRGEDGIPTHFQYKQGKDLNWRHALAHFWIDPDGQQSNTEQGHDQTINQIDPRLIPDTWSFQSTYDVDPRLQGTPKDTDPFEWASKVWNSDIKPWTPGHEGKAIVTPSGRQMAWQIGANNNYHYNHAQSIIGEKGHSSSLYNSVRWFILVCR